MSFVDDQKNTIASQLADRLRDVIVSGVLGPGTKINLERVREKFDVSLSPLREALARLIADGLVEFQDNRGYWVAPVSLENLEEITQLRVHFETYALGQAMENGDVEWESGVMSALHRLNRTDRADRLEHWEAAHREFHLALLAGCNMPTLLSFCRKLLNLSDRYRRAFLRTTPDDRDITAEHGEIAQGAVARDRDYACARLADHIGRTGAALRSHLSRDPAFLGRPRPVRP